MTSNTRHGVFCLLLLTAGLATLSSQTEYVRFDRLSTEHGLSNVSVYGVMQDRTGLMWIGTQVGLNRYNGHDVVTFYHDPNDSTSLSFNSVGKGVEDEAGFLWFATWGGGLNRFDRRTSSFKAFLHANTDSTTLGDNRIHDLVIDREQRLWVATFADGLDVLDLRAEKKTFIHVLGDTHDSVAPGENRVWSIAVDSQGFVWAGSERGLFKIDPRSHDFTRFVHDPGHAGSISNNVVMAVYCDRRGTVWAGTMNGLNRLESDGKSFRRYGSEPGSSFSLGDSRVRSICEDEEGRLWVGTFSEGIYRLDERQSNFIRYRSFDQDPEPSDDLIRVMHVDRSGLLWIGKGAHGIEKLNLKKQFRLYQALHGATSPNHLLHQDVIAIAEADLRTLLIATYGGGLSVFDRTTGMYRHHVSVPGDPSTLSDSRVRVLKRDSGGRWWVGTNRGLNLFELKSGRVTRIGQGALKELADVRVSALAETRDGGLWIGTDGSGLYRLTAQGRLERFQHRSDDAGSLSNDLITVLMTDRAGCLWIGTDGGGLNRFEAETGRFARFKHDPRDAGSLRSNVVTGLLEDPEGQLWIGTNGGALLRLNADGRSFEAFGEEHGLDGNVIYGILRDDNGYLWCGTYRGIARFDPQRRKFRSYDWTDGVLIRGFGERAYNPCRTSDGHMFFGCLNGFMEFNPSEIRDNTIVPAVMISEFRKFDRPSRWIPGQTIELNHKENFFSFSFAVLDYTNPAKNQYAYRLEGFDDEWVFAGTRRMAAYTNLDEGNYRLMIKGANSDGVWNDEGASVVLKIHPPFWRTWWFRVLAIGFMMATLFVFVRLRLRNVERQKQMLQREVEARTRELSLRNDELNALMKQKNEFLGIAAHDLRSPLSTLIGYLGLMIQDIEDNLFNPDEMKEDMRQMHRAAKNMNAMISSLLNITSIDSGSLTLKTEPLRMQELLEECESLYKRHAVQKDISLHIDVPQNLPMVNGDRTRLIEVIDNLLSNAIKYTHPGGEVRVHCERKNGEVITHINDNGQGLSEDDLQYIFREYRKLSARPTAGEDSTGLGLAIVKKIVELHHGRVWVESRKNHGSTFSFSLPVHD